MHIKRSSAAPALVSEFVKTEVLFLKEIEPVILCPLLRLLQKYVLCIFSLLHEGIKTPRSVSSFYFEILSSISLSIGNRSRCGVRFQG